MSRSAFFFRSKIVFDLFFSIRGCCLVAKIINLDGAENITNRNEILELDCGGEVFGGKSQLELTMRKLYDFSSGDHSQNAVERPSIVIMALKMGDLN